MDPREPAAIEHSHRDAESAERCFQRSLHDFRQLVVDASPSALPVPATDGFAKVRALLATGRIAGPMARPSACSFPGCHDTTTRSIGAKPVCTFHHDVAIERLASVLFVELERCAATPER